MISIHIIPSQELDGDQVSKQLTPLIEKIKAVLQKPRLVAVDPTKPIVIQVTEDLINCMGTDDMPAEPILIIPGNIIQCFVPHIQKIVTLIFQPKQPIAVQVHEIAVTTTTWD